jgi:hypothetical protein
LATGLHVPVEQELHVPQAVWQQIPVVPPLAITQLPFWHWLLPAQGLPSSMAGLHVPEAQKLPAAQSVSTVHPVLQAVAEAQPSAFGQGLGMGLQACEVSQAFVVSVAPEHDGVPHAVPLAG